MSLPMPRQASFADLEYASKKRQTRRELFLNEMESVVPWSALLARIEPYYPKSGKRGRPPMALESMLRIYCAQNWFNYSDRQMEDALYEIESLRRFAGFSGVTAALPDETTILNFRHFLEKHDLTAALLSAINSHLKAQGLLVSKGSMVDATIIHAASSTKNQGKTRDPEMHQTKKGKDWHFGMKVHIGADSKTGLVHSASVTAANVHDSHEVPNLLHGQETRLYGDSAYRGKAQRERLRELAPKAKDFTNKRAYKNRPLTEADKATNRRKSSIRSKVEHPFLTLKRLWGFAKVRYRGLAKNANRAFAMLAMINLNKWGRPLTGEVRPA